jgi:hypothetical protein
MVLLGKWAWWMPRWLDRFTPHISIEGEEFFAKRDAALAMAGASGGSSAGVPASPADGPISPDIDGK